MEIEVWRIIAGIVFGLASIAVAVEAILSWLCKGPLISQAWTIGTPEQRAKLDKKTEYHNVASVMTGLFPAFVLLGFYCVLEQTGKVEWMFWVAIICAFAGVFMGMMGGAKKIARYFSSSPKNNDSQTKE